MLGLASRQPSLRESGRAFIAADSRTTLTPRIMPPLFADAVGAKGLKSDQLDPKCYVVVAINQFAVGLLRDFVVTF